VRWIKKGDEKKSREIFPKPGRAATPKNHSLSLLLSGEREIRRGGEFLYNI